MPGWVWERIREAIPVFGAENIRIYAPDRESFRFPCRDPMVLACWRGRWFRVAAWGLSEDLGKKATRYSA
jgi:hypothetical protein